MLSCGWDIQVSPGDKLWLRYWWEWSTPQGDSRSQWYVNQTKCIYGTFLYCSIQKITSTRSQCLTCPWGHLLVALTNSTLALQCFSLAMDSATPLSLTSGQLAQQSRRPQSSIPRVEVSSYRERVYAEHRLSMKLKWPTLGVEEGLFQYLPLWHPVYVTCTFVNAQLVFELI